MRSESDTGRYDLTQRMPLHISNKVIDLCKIKAAKLVEKYRIAEKLIRNLPSIDVSKEDQVTIYFIRCGYASEFFP